MTSLVDIALLILIGVFAVSGFRTGLMRGAVHLLALYLGLLVAADWYPRVSQSLPTSVGDSASFLAFVLIVLGTIIATLLVASVIFGVARALPRPFIFRRVNEALGVIPGVIKGLIVAAFLIAVINRLPAENGFRREVDASRIGSQISARSAEIVSNFIRDHEIPTSDFDVPWSAPTLPKLPQL